MSNQSFESTPVDNTIVAGDVREVLRDLPFLGIDCIVTSPPYWNLRSYTEDADPREIGHEPAVEDYVNDLADLFFEVGRHMTPKGSIWVNLGDNFVDGQPLLVPWRFLFAMQSRGFQVRNVVIWYKPDAMSESTVRRFSQKYEPFFWFTMSDDYYFNHEAATIPCKLSTVQRLEHEFYANKGTAVSRMGGLIGDMSSKIDEYLSRGVNAGDAWIINTNKEKVEHIAPYPVELVLRPILATCPPGGLVFDPFMGSGTTALAVAEMGEGRRYFGTDINPKAVEQANTRIAPEVAQGKLF